MLNVAAAGAKIGVRGLGADEMVSLRDDWPTAVRVDVVRTSSLDPVGGEATNDAFAFALVRSKAAWWS
ncbi:hypothetical protein E1181_29580 [Saccharopolyspora terrae]|uniref:Uncharacterized protein n=1 Tax=Saccharopolyspora terrae TaxID=2530384 RepID=A0A4R4V7Q1_9PSEU|nr:hypothetical protein [Saccharopolyspora terrae]TDC99376.1 hypothetical protein E1181_29580 [Saccharopolyspora terrae]